MALLLAGVHQFEGPVSGARIIMDTEGAFVFDPTFEQTKTAQLELIVAGTPDAITMVEFIGKEASDEQVVAAFEFAHTVIGELCAAQLDYLETYQKTHAIPTCDLCVVEKDASLKNDVLAHIDEDTIGRLYGLGKIDFHHELEQIGKEVREKLEYTEDTEEMKGADIDEHIYGYVKKIMRKNVLESGRRLDGRSPQDVRPVQAEPGILPRTHGSVLFQRGVTSALSIATLGGPRDAELVDGMFTEYSRRYMHHYNFPPYSVGEVRPMRGVGRREVGHGNLAERALLPVLPDEETFPYVVRVVSEITTCNGSSSMASVCGSSLALMDAGVPIKAVVSGVAMGMIYDEESGKHVVLSDIQAQEDFLGDLDFKVAGTKNGITALQMDCKIAGLDLSVVKEVLTQSK